MSTYIVCNRKRNSPRLNIRVCQEKCPTKKRCKEFLAYFRGPVNQKETPLTSPGTP